MSCSLNSLKGVIYRGLFKVRIIGPSVGFKV